MVHKKNNLLLRLFLLLLPTIMLGMKTEIDTIKHKPLFSIKDLKHKRNNLKEYLESDYHIFVMWDPTDDDFRAFYKEKNKTRLLKIIIPLYSPSMRVNKRSALGVTTMLPNLSLHEKREIIQELIPLHFIPTPEDKELAFLEWWERIPFNKIILLHCVAQKEPTNIISTLPHESLMYLAAFVIYSEKPLF